MTNEEFEQIYYPKYNSIIKAIARKMANSDNELWKDLRQEGLLALLKCDISQVKDNEDAFIRQAIKFRMIDYIRREARGRECSWDRLLPGEGLIRSPRVVPQVYKNFYTGHLNDNMTDDDYEDAE